jgi:hypothetical protein
MRPRRACSRGRRCRRCRRLAPKAHLAYCRSRDRPGSCHRTSRCRVEGVDLARREAEISDQQVAAELTEPRRRQSQAPRGGELAAGDQSLQEAAVLVEDIHDPHSRRSGELICTPGRSVGHVDLAANVLHVEWDEPGRKVRVSERAGEADRVKRAVENVDPAASIAVGGV